MATNDCPAATALPRGLLDQLRADARPELRPGELQRARERLATASIDEPAVIAAIADGLLEAGGLVRVADS